MLTSKAIYLSILSVGILLLGLFLSLFSGRIVIGHDSSQVDTVGEIYFHGFPIWFLETAPGYSVVDGWHFQRLFVNTLSWICFLVLIAFVMVRYLTGDERRTRRL